MFVEAAGAVLVFGGLACVASAIAGRRSWLVAALFAAALGAAAADAFGAGSAFHAIACALGFAGASVMVLERLGKPLPMTWLDFVMGGCAVGALSATTGAELGATLGASGVAAALGLVDPDLARVAVLLPTVLRVGLARPAPQAYRHGRAGGAGAGHRRNTR